MKPQSHKDFVSHLRRSWICQAGSSAFQTNPPQESPNCLREEEKHAVFQGQQLAKEPSLLHTQEIRADTIWRNILNIKGPKTIDLMETRWSLQFQSFFSEMVDTISISNHQPLSFSVFFASKKHFCPLLSVFHSTPRSVFKYSLPFHQCKILQNDLSGRCSAVMVRALFASVNVCIHW